MAPDPHAEDGGDPVTVFHSQLRDLHLAAGKPSARVLERKSGYGSTTCNDVLRGARFPSWEVTEALVSVLGGDVVDWRARWQEGRRALDARQAGPGSARSGAAGAPPPADESPGPPPAGESAAETGSAAGPAAQPWWRRPYVALASVLGGAVLAVALLLVFFPDPANLPTSTPASPTCPTVRTYNVKARGNLLDASGHVAGQVVPGDVVEATTLDPSPYHSRRKVTVLSSGREGYVDLAKLNLVKTECRTRS
jgi:hypothetical protein